MVQIPPNIAISMKAHKGNEAAAYLEGVVNEYAADGWEFYRIDSIGVQLKPGCFDALMGKKEEYSQYHVVRRYKVGLALYSANLSLSPSISTKT